jgi:hypothetical protein
MGEKFIDDDPSEWLKDNVDYFIKNAKNSRETNHDYNENIIKSTDLLHLMLDATEKNFTDINQVKILSIQSFLNVFFSYFSPEVMKEFYH